MCCTSVPTAEHTVQSCDMRPPLSIPSLHLLVRVTQIVAQSFLCHVTHVGAHEALPACPCIDLPSALLSPSLRTTIHTPARAIINRPRTSWMRRVARPALGRLVVAHAPFSTRRAEAKRTKCQVTIGRGRLSLSTTTLWASRAGPDPAPRTAAGLNK